MAEVSGLGLITQYPYAWKIFLTVFVATNLVTGVLYLAATRWKLMPAIRKRDVHTARKPRVGGVAMWIVTLGSLIALAVGNSGGSLNFGEGFIGVSSLLLGILGGMTALLLFGLLDDLFGLTAAWQLLGQIVAGASLVMGGLTVPYLRIPLMDDPLYLSQLWSAVFVISWVVVMINAINLFDGLDGLAGSLSMTASVILFLVSLKLGFIGAATLCLILFGVTAGFLPWNWHPSRLFMGTVGSQLLGFLLGTVAVISGGKVATAMLVLGIPLFDAVTVVIRRLIAGQSPFKADQRHLHHRLLKLGLTPPYVVLVTNVLAIGFGILAITTQQASQKGMLILMLIFAMFLVIAITHFLERRSTRQVQ